MRTQKPQLLHRGYTGTVNYSHDDKVFWGKLDGIKATVTYEGHDADSLEAAFKEAVEDYLDLCRQEGMQPEKPYKGVFSVRVPQYIHRDLAYYAKAEQTNLNNVARQAFEHFLQCKEQHA